MVYSSAVLGLTVAAVLACGQQSNPSSGGWRDANAPQPQDPPSQLTLPAGTWISVRTDEVLSSDHNLPGVADAVKAGRVKGTSRLALELTDVTLADGQNRPVKTQLIQYAGGTSKGRDATAIGTATGIGAAAGGAVDGGAGSGIGAAAGAAASTIGVLMTRGLATEVFPESLLTFRITEPLTISTDRSSRAFVPVRQEDYEPDAQPRQPRLARRPGYGGYPYPYAYPPLYGGVGVVIVRGGRYYR